MEIAVLGIDLGKSSCSVVGLDRSGRVVLRRRMHRDSVVKLASGLPARIVAMEAGCGAHHLGRLFADMGHQVRLMSPEYVRPYEGAEERRPELRSDRGAGHPTDNALCRTEVG